MYKKYANKMLCFSPPVMLVTFLIEFGFAFYVLWRYKLTAVSRLITAMLLLLGTFQLTEYMICGGLGLQHIEWARLGYISITLLPALGVHLVMTLAGKKSIPLLIAAYGSALAYVAYFSTAGNPLIGHVCSANYAIFHVNGLGRIGYAFYYYGWLIIAAGLAAYWSNKKPKTTPVMRWMIAGYASFIIPTTFANIVDPSTIAGIPSIMCGFAVLFALILIFRVLPLSKVPVMRTVSSQSKHQKA